MKKNIFGISLLLMFLAFAQMAVAQTIIMGSTPLVGDIDEEVRNFYDPACPALWVTTKIPMAISHLTSKTR